MGLRSGVFRWYGEWREQLIEVVVVGEVVWWLWRASKMDFLCKVFFDNELICDDERRLRAGTQEKILLRGEILERSGGPAACPSCAEAHEAAAKYCRRCGSELRADSVLPVEAIIDISIEDLGWTWAGNLNTMVRASVFIDGALVELLSQEDIEEIKGS